MTVRLALLLSAALLLVGAARASAATTNGQWVIVDHGGSAEALTTLNPITRTDLGRDERVLYTAAAGHHLQAPQWSADGNRIVFADDSQVLVYDLPSHTVATVSAGTAPTWVGSRVAFVRDGQLLTRRVDGGDEQVLPVDATGVQDVAGSPDGDWLALWVGDHIDLASVDGSERETIGDHALGGAAWLPYSTAFVYSWARPDGEKLVAEALLDGERSADRLHDRAQPAGERPRARPRAGRQRARLHAPRAGRPAQPLAGCRRIRRVLQRRAARTRSCPHSRIGSRASPG